MIDYISREAAISRIKEAIPYHDNSITGLERAIGYLKSIPAADVAPVVRCADCKWFQINMRQDGYLPHGVPECECRHWCGECDPTDFCSYGARMDGDDNGN